MRILLISSYYLPSLGGVQTAVHNLAQQFQARGHAAAVIANRYPRTVAVKETLDGIPVRRLLFLYPQWHYLRIGRPDLFLGGLVYGPLTMLSLIQLFLQFRPDVINLQHPDHPNPFVLWLRKLFRVRLVVSLQGDEILKYHEISAGQQKLLSTVLQQADAVTACSTYLLNEAICIEPGVASKGRVIPNGVNLERFAVAASVLTYPRPYIFAAGRLATQKGFDVLIEAFGRIAYDHPEVDLLIAGDGEQRQRLDEMIAQLSLQRRVYLIGRVTPEQMVALLKGCCVAVIPSRWEPFGIVALEAIAAGKPIIASRVGGLPELLDGLSDVFWVEPDIVDDLAHSISESLSEDRSRSAGVDQHPRELLAGYQWSVIADRYLQVLGLEDR